MAQRSLLFKPKSQKFLAYLEAPFKPPVQAAFQAPTIIHGIKEGILTGIKGHAAIHGLRCHLYMQKVGFSHQELQAPAWIGEEDVPRHEKFMLRIQGSA